MFLRIIAYTFLFIFFIKLINPKVIPYLKDIWTVVKSVFRYTFFVLTNGFFYAIHLLVSKTVYMMSIVIVSTIIITITLSVYLNFNTLSFNGIWNSFQDLIINLYVWSFFVVTYLIGIIEVIRKKQSFKEKVIIKFNTKIDEFTRNKGKYIYDEEQEIYTYKD